MRTSREAGKLIAMKESLAGNPPDLERMEKILEGRMRWFWEEDITGECVSAGEVFEGLCKAGNCNV